MPKLLPSPFHIFAATVAGLFGIITTARGLNDADVYWHLTAGRLVAERGVMTADPFSYTWAGQPWVMHEWLGELVLFSAVELLGVGVATFLFGVLSISGVLLVAGALSARGVATMPLVAVTSLVAFLFLSYATIRPQAMSWLLLGMLVSALLSLRGEERWRPWLAVPLFALWANVHGLYVVGLGVLGIYVLFSLIGRTPMRDRRRTSVAVLVAAFGASALTPAGLAGLTYPLRYVDSGDWGLRYIAEWQSPDFHDPMQLGLLVFIAAILAIGMRGSTGWLVTVATGGVVGALLATRNVPVAGILALPVLATGMASHWRRGIPYRSPREQVGRRVIELIGAAAVLAAAATIVPRLPSVGQTAIAASFPVAAVDVLERVDPAGRVFAEYGWGGYVIARLHEHGGRVFVDGRNDMYDDRILDDFVTIRNAEAGWESVLAGHGASSILVPPEARLVPEALRSGAWCERHRDDVAVLLVAACR